MPNNEYATKEQNVPEDVFDAWKKMRRRDDAKALVAYTGKSYPVISSALKNGFCATQELMDKISEYFAKRPQTPLKISKKAQKAIDKANSLDSDS